MKTLTTLLLCFSLSLVFVACGDDDCDSASFSAEFQTELDDINTAVSAYAADQSQENCDNLKDAYNDYIDALEDWEDCAEELEQETEWQEALEDARDSVDSIC